MDRLWGFPSDSAVKNLPAMQETWVSYQGQEDLLEEGKATHSSILCMPSFLHAWRIPWTEEPGRLQSKGGKELDATKATLHASTWIDFRPTVY